MAVILYCKAEASPRAKIPQDSFAYLRSISVSDLASTLFHVASNMDRAFVEEQIEQLIEDASYYERLRDSVPTYDVDSDEFNNNESSSDEVTRDVPSCLSRIVGFMRKNFLRLIHLLW